MSSSVPTKRRQSGQSRKVYYSVQAESSQVCQYINTIHPSSIYVKVLAHLTTFC